MTPQIAFAVLCIKQSTNQQKDTVQMYTDKQHINNLM